VYLNVDVLPKINVTTLAVDPERRGGGAIDLSTGS
jgi:hypothetical protein